MSNRGLGLFADGGGGHRGPEFGTIRPELIREAAQDAVAVADLLVVCGFAFDPLAGEEASTLDRLTILEARLDPDLGRRATRCSRRPARATSSWSSASLTSSSARKATVS